MGERRTRVPSIPQPSADNLLSVVTAIKEAVEVRGGLRGDVLDGAVTFRDLTDIGLVQEPGSSTQAVLTNGQPVVINPALVLPPWANDNYDPETDLTTPPAPTSLIASGAYSAIYLTWTYPAYRNHAYTEVWRSSADSLASATLIGTSPVPLYSDPVGTEQTYYYWVRNVSRANVRSPFNSLAGALGKTALDVVRRIAELEDAVRSDTLTRDLTSRVALLETAQGSYAKQLNTFSDSQATLTNQLISNVGANSVAIQIQQNVQNGLEAQYTVKIDNNGYVAGYGLSSSSATGTPRSAFTVSADRFAVVSPNAAMYTITSLTRSGTTGTMVLSSGGSSFAVGNYFSIHNVADGLWNGVFKVLTQSTNTNTITFTVSASATTPAVAVSGKTMQAAVNAVPFIVDGSSVYMNTALIGTASISSAQIGSLNADKINSGSITVALDLQAPTVRSGNITFSSPGFYLGYDGSTPKFYVGDGVNKYLKWDGANLSVRGAVYADSGSFVGSVTATSGYIGNCVITTNAVSSSTYEPGSTGWTIKQDGTAEFAAASIRGALTATQIAVGQRTVHSTISFMAVPNARLATGSPTTTSIPVASLPLYANHTYTMSVYWPDGVMEKRSLINASGNATTLNIAAGDAFYRAPVAGSLVVVQPSGVVTPPTGTVGASATTTSIPLGTSVALARGARYVLNVVISGVTYTRAVALAEGSAVSTLTTEAFPSAPASGSPWALYYAGTANTVAAWTAGAVIYPGAAAAVSVAAGYVEYDGSTQYIYIPASATGSVSASTTTTFATANAQLHLATYDGGQAVAVTAPSTLIDGTQIRTKSITAEIGAIGDLAVNTLQIAGNAVTQPSGVFTKDTAAFTTTAATKELAVQSLTLSVPADTQVFITFSAHVYTSRKEEFYACVRRGTTELWAAGNDIAPNYTYKEILPNSTVAGGFIDTPGAGSVTYTMYLGHQLVNYEIRSTFRAMQGVTLKR